MYIIKRTSCLKQKSLLTAFCKSVNTRTNYRNITRLVLINTVKVSSVRHAISYLNPWSLSFETDSRSLTQAIPCFCETGNFIGVCRIIRSCHRTTSGTNSTPVHTLSINILHSALQTSDSCLFIDMLPVKL